MSKHAKNQIDWETVLEVLIFIVSAIKELVKRANEQDGKPEENKEIGNKDQKFES